MPRAFVTWILTLIIIQSLYLRRGFLHRCALALFVMGLTTLPYLMLKGAIIGTTDERVAVDSMVSGDFNNSNGLGGWFGFCCLYFTIVGVETRRHGVRVASSLAALVCLYIVGLSVSRGALLGTAIGITIALRGLLRRGFVPLLVFIILSGVIYNFGVFDQSISRYSARGTEETGRFLVWPLAIERYLSSPLLGGGAASVNLRVPTGHKEIAPHNSFIWFALSSGVVPLAFFVAWWIRAARNSVSYGKGLADGPFRLPLLVFTFVTILFGDLGFMTPWGIVTLCAAMAPNTPYGVRRLVVRRFGRRQTAQRFGHHSKARPYIAHYRL
jgi:hypothetical protein